MGVKPFGVQGGMIPTTFSVCVLVREGGVPTDSFPAFDPVIEKGGTAPQGLHDNFFFFGNGDNLKMSHGCVQSKEGPSPLHVVTELSSENEVRF